MVGVVGYFAKRHVGIGPSIISQLLVLSCVRFGGTSEISYYLESNREDRVERVEYRNEVYNEFCQPEMMNLYIDTLPFVLRGLGFSEEATAKLDNHARSLRPVEVRENGLVGEVRVEQYRNGGHEIGVYITDESVIERYRPAKWRRKQTRRPGVGQGAGRS